MKGRKIESRESEKTVIGGLLLDYTQFEIISEQLCTADFSHKYHQHIFACMKYLYEKRKIFDIPMILDLEPFYGDFPLEKYMFDLANGCPSVANIKAHADIIREKSVQRQLLQVANEIAEEAAHPKTNNIKDILDKAEESVMKLAEAYEINICPVQHRLVCFMEEFAAEIKATDLTVEYIKDCMYEMNKAFIDVIDHLEEEHEEE